MSDTESRQKDILLLVLAVQLSVFVMVMPVLFPLVFVSGFLTLSVIVNEAIRRLDDYSGR